MNRTIRTTGLAFLIASASLAGCAAAPQPPDDALKLAESAIAHAEDARVADYASLELKTAREKLSQARELSQKAVQDGSEQEAQKARWLAEESRADAELATAKAQKMRADNVNLEMQRNIDTLRTETQRNGHGG